jgi:hypothetical protein
MQNRIFLTALPGPKPAGKKSQLHNLSSFARPATPMRRWGQNAKVLTALKGLPLG